MQDLQTYLKQGDLLIADGATGTMLQAQGLPAGIAPELWNVEHPEVIHLPKSHITSKYIFAASYDFLVYPNNYNQMVNYYRNTFQHGGVSLEEMLIPLVILNPS